MDSLNELIFEFTSVWLLIKYREAEGVLVRKKRELDSWEGMREGHAVHTQNSQHISHDKLTRYN